MSKNCKQIKTKKNEQKTVSISLPQIDGIELKNATLIENENGNGANRLLSVRASLSNK